MPALIYTSDEGGLVSIILPSPGEDRDTVMASVRSRPGCEVLIVSEAAYAQAGADLQPLVNAHTGKTPADNRHAIVHRQTGAVADVLLVYPSVFRLGADYEFVASRQARKGDVYENGGRTDDDIARVKAEKAAAEAEAALDR